MIIDFHTHTFPDKIAERTLNALSSVSGLKPYTNGTVYGLTASMKEAGIDASLILPVVTKPSQFDTVNSVSAEINGKDGLYSFGGIHPDCDNIEEKLDRIVSLGLKGIKLHPEYQNCPVDDPKNVNIIKQAVMRGLFVVIHAGVDLGYPDRVNCSPIATRKMLDEVYPAFNGVTPHIILAHLGGNLMWDEVYTELCSLPVYFDISFSLSEIKPELFGSIVRKHGANKLLFGTDSPWNSQAEEIIKFYKIAGDIGLSEKEKNLILSENARKILDI